MGIGKRFVLLLLGIGLIAFSFSPALAQQTGKIVGKVTDARTGQPLGSANVLVEGTKLGASTDLDGVYFILNVPPGTYTVQTSILGYKPVRYENVRVSTGLTTTLDFELEETVMEAAEAVTFVAERPLIQKDQTESRTTRNADDLKLMPVRTVNEVVQLTAGTVGGNFRGGRGAEVAYLVDGALMVDPMTGNQENNIPMIAFEEINVITGGMSAEYGNALSGVVAQVTKEGADRISGEATMRTNDAGSTFIGQRDQMKDVQASLSGRVPFLPRSMGDMYFFGSGQWYTTRGWLEHDNNDQTSAFGKMTYKISPQHKLTASGSVSNTWWSTYGHMWNRDTREDYLSQFDPEGWDTELDGAYPFLDDNGNPWYGNGEVNTEDRNHNGVLDAGEDLNGNGAIDTEDLNHDLVLGNTTPDVYDMQGHRPYSNQHTNSFSLKWNHALSSKSFYEISISRYQTKAHYNTREKYNEDANGNGILDLEESFGSIDDISDADLAAYGHLLRSNADGTFYWFDHNQNGVYEYEDLNGNAEWDWVKYGRETDLFRDDNDDGIIDASEGSANPLRWQDINFNSNSRDNDNYYQYGDGKTYNRARWNNDDKVIWTLNANATGQVHRYHQLKSGIELKAYSIMDHDVDMASGGNVYGQSISADPRSFGAWLEDKMEFEGMIVNLGFRLDAFDVNWNEFPVDITDPLNDDGSIKKPTSLDPEYYWSPRLGVAFPITERDLLSFNYSRNFQIPVFASLFTNATYDMSGAFPLVGNPSLEPERTTSYELTLRHQFSDDLVVVATGFFKDISGLVDTRQVFYTSLNWYGLYINKDYGNVRGFELSLEKRFSNFYSGNISYTYSVAKGKSSTTTQGYLTAYNSTVPRTTENYLNWDQRHTVYGNIQFMIPKGTRPFGQSWLDEVSFSIIGQYGSGLPYSSPSSSQNPPINDKRLPHTLSFDGRMQKRFSVSKNFGFYGYLAVYNMFDQRNIAQRYFQGTANVEWYENTDENNIQRGAPGYNGTKDVDGQYDDPQFWERGRRYELGVGIEF